MVHFRRNDTRGFECPLTPVDLNAP
uniref:Uncharacterized protein n=1 Tax=Anguilla anguilla TaxID=7936 RepID=A0A0E9XI65_ANGAN